MEGNIRLQMEYTNGALINHFRDIGSHFDSQRWSCYAFGIARSTTKTLMLTAAATTPTTIPSRGGQRTMPARNPDVFIKMTETCARLWLIPPSEGATAQ